MGLVGEGWIVCTIQLQFDVQFNPRVCKLSYSGLNWCWEYKGLFMKSEWLRASPPAPPNFNVENASTCAVAETGFYSPWPVYTRVPTTSTLKLGVRGEGWSTICATGFYIPNTGTLSTSTNLVLKLKWAFCVLSWLFIPSTDTDLPKVRVALAGSTGAKKYQEALI